jgi:hypothetical protein
MIDLLMWVIEFLLVLLPVWAMVELARWAWGQPGRETRGEK